MDDTRLWATFYTSDDAIAVLTMANPRILARNGSTSTAPTGLLLYELATPTTEHGYIDLPDIPEGAVVSMPELEGLGVESWTGDAVADYTSAAVGKAEDSVSQLFDFDMNETRMWATFYATSDRKNAIQLGYERGSDKYTISRKISGTWGGSRTIG